jgi:DMSO/TMAO reductase YedYZ molybdopterin-dependent catalytic subunit
MMSEPAWLHGHAHEPNPAPPTPDPTLVLVGPDGGEQSVAVEDLARLPQRVAADCYIVSTGHGTSGPFTFRGVALDDLIAARLGSGWQYADVISADGFGNRVLAHELPQPHPEGSRRPILLATLLDGQPLSREAGLVRLIVPNEIDDALRQVKWVARIEVH